MSGARARRVWRPARRLLLLLFLLALSRPAAPLAAQILDTLSDSLPEDTVDYTARFLEAQENVGLRVPVMPAPGVSGPRPALTRIVFNRDSIEWGHASTVGDLLLQVPGVYLWRGGFLGRPEPVNYQGRGSTSVEYFLDGVPYRPAGVDSVVSRMATGTPTMPAARGEYPSVPCRKSATKANWTYSAP